MSISAKNPLTVPQEIEEDEGYDVSLRPKSLSEYIGQEKIKKNLSVFIEAAKQRQEALDHVLLYGPPGLGKTTLAYIMAREMGVDIKVTSGPVIERPGDLAAILTNLHEQDILFIDEIHRLSHVVEEILYPAMEDFHIDILIGQGPSARSMKLEIPKFTLIGATTRAGLLTSPLRDRFGMSFRFEFYTPEELAVIIRRSAKILSVDIDRRRRGRDGLPFPGDAADRQPPAPPGPGFRPGQGRGTDHPGGGGECPGDVRGG